MSSLQTYTPGAVYQLVKGVVKGGQHTRGSAVPLLVIQHVDAFLVHLYAGNLVAGVKQRIHSGLCGFVAAGLVAYLFSESIAYE